MKVAFIADVHIGNHKAHGGPVESGINHRCAMTLDVLRSAICTAVDDYEVDTVVVLGDLFDSVRPLPQMIRAVQKILDYAPKVLLLMGNHERVSEAEGDHALGPLKSAKVKVLSDSEDARGLWMVPFKSGDAKEWLNDELEKLLRRADARTPPLCVCLHLGLRDASSPSWTSAAADAVDVQWLSEFCSAWEIPRVFAGNWHSFKEWQMSFPDRAFSCQMTQVGALVPTGWDNPGMIGYGNVELLNCDVARFEVAGPRFIEIRGLQDLRDALDKAIPGTKLFVRAKVHPDEVAQARELLSQVVLVNPVIESLDVMADSEAIAISARKASDAARSMTTMSEVVHAFFKEAAMPEVDKKKVEAAVLGYLRLAV